MNVRMYAVAGLGLAALVAAPVSAGVAHLIDFETEDDFVTPLVNGQSVASPDEFGNLFNVSASGNNLGAAIFDTSFGGPNDGGGDTDLIVGLGNVLILQSNDSPDQTVSDIFDTPNDSAQGGMITFDFLAPTMLMHVDLVDIDGSVDVNIVITDGNGFTRSYYVEPEWTFDIEADGPNGYDTLDLTSIAAQQGEGGAFATGSEDAGFDANNVVSMSFEFSGSAAVDNLAFVTIPAPGAGVILLSALISGRTRRRRA